MTSETPQRIRMWSFRQAPLEFQSLFPEGSDSDWVAHVPEPERPVVESSLLQWRPVYPVRVTELADRSTIYFGAPRNALESIGERSKLITDPHPVGQERRRAARVRIECPSRYETPQQAGFGHTIDISSKGVAFTTENMLARNTEVSLHVTWPVRLEGDVPVELYAVGKLVRAEQMKAAMQMDSGRWGFRRS